MYPTSRPSISQTPYRERPSPDTSTGTTTNPTATFAAQSSSDAATLSEARCVRLAAGGRSNAAGRGGVAASVATVSLVQHGAERPNEPVDRSVVGWEGNYAVTRREVTQHLRERGPIRSRQLDDLAVGEVAQLVVPLAAAAQPSRQNRVGGVEQHHAVEQRSPLGSPAPPPARRAAVAEGGGAEYAHPAQREHGALVEHDEPGMAQPAPQQQAQGAESDDLRQDRPGDGSGPPAQAYQRGQGPQRAREEQRPRQVPDAGADSARLRAQPLRERALSRARRADELHHEGPRRVAAVSHRDPTTPATGWP